jgi:hypothetical protein
MGCECIPPPPVFDLPPPPDPSLIWHLISDEPESVLRKVRLQTCEFNPIYEFIGLEGTLQGLLIFGLSCFLTVLFIVCLATLCYQKICRRKHPKRSPSSTADSSKFNSSSDTIVTNGAALPQSQWNPRSPQFVTIGMPQYGSASVNNIASNTSLIRSQPVMGIQSSTTMMRIPRHPQQQPRSMAVRQPMDQGSAYCTLNRHYEEIPVNYALPPSTASSTIPTSFSHNFVRGSSRRFEEQPTQAMLFLDRLAQNVERKPPPTSKPPPPPPSDSLNRSSASTDELDGSSLDAEIEVINRQHCSPINSRQSEFGGRESGYGTGPSRLWNHQSPRAPPRTLKEFSPASSNSSSAKFPPSLKLCGNNNVNTNDSQNPMTYV